MNTSRVSISAVKLGALAAILVLPLTACGEAASPEPGTTTRAARPAESPSGHSAHGEGGTSVQMQLVKFRPERIEVPAGTEVTWTQNDAGFHTVTSGTVSQKGGGVTVEPDGRFASDELATGESFKFRFDEPGTYLYFCEIHPATMTGEVRAGNE